MTGIYDLTDPGARSHYDALRKATDQLTPFSSLTYADAVAQAYGLTGRIHLVEPSAGAVTLLRRSAHLKRAIVPPFTQYSALVLPQKTDEQTIHARSSPLEKILQSIEQACWRADLLCRLDDPRPAKWRNWQVSPLYTYVLPTTHDAQHWSPSARRLYQTKSAEYECLESADMASSVIELCQRSYARHGRSLPGSQDALRKTVEHLGPMASVFVALENGQPQAGIIVLHEGSMAHYWISGSQPGAAMTVLIGHVLTTLQESGIELFDLVGANTPSIAEFKRRFGARLELYFHLRRHPLARFIS